jgi:hypothetical protein
MQRPTTVVILPSQDHIVSRPSPDAMFVAYMQLPALELLAPAKIKWHWSPPKLSRVTFLEE